MASVTRLERGDPELRDATIAHLEDLAVAVSRRGMAASLIAVIGRLPRLQVTSAAGVTEDIYASRGEDGAWWFWWSWAQRIATVTDTGGAATVVERSLRGPASE